MAFSIILQHEMNCWIYGASNDC